MASLLNSNYNSGGFRSMRLAFTALAASLLLAGCATMGSPAREPVTRDLPDPPAYLQPVEKPAAKEGTSPFVVSEQRGAVIDRQNYVIVQARKAWHTMKRTYSKSLIRRSIFGG